MGSILELTSAERSEAISVRQPGAPEPAQSSHVFCGHRELAEKQRFQTNP